jgi:hypothetical protein
MIEFESQICTTREQSERLIALGLKKETADMCWCNVLTNGNREWLLIPISIKAYTKMEIPAWSLHSLIELKQPNTIDNAIVVLSREQTYDKLIGMIAKSIKEGFFPKEYLED